MVNSKKQELKKRSNIFAWTRRWRTIQKKFGMKFINEWTELFHFEHRLSTFFIVLRVSAFPRFAFNHFHDDSLSHETFRFSGDFRFFLCYENDCASNKIERHSIRTTNFAGKSKYLPTVVGLTVCFKINVYHKGTNRSWAICLFLIKWAQHTQ